MKFNINKLIKSVNHTLKKNKKNISYYSFEYLKDVKGLRIVIEMKPWESTDLDDMDYEKEIKCNTQ